MPFLCIFFILLVSNIVFASNIKEKFITCDDQLRRFSRCASLGAEFKRATVVVDHGLCAEIGRDILLEGGNAVDAAISSLLCAGVVNPQSSGLGGGFMMTIFNVTTGRCITVDARETAPNITIADGALTGYTSIATPGELHGYWTAWRRFGGRRVTWPRLFEPSIRLARTGFPVSGELAALMKAREADIFADDHLKRNFIDSVTGKVYKEGDIMRRKRLADLLDELANVTDPVELFYKGGMAQTIAGEMDDDGGHVSLADLAAYTSVVYETPPESDALPPEWTMCGPPPPSAFVIVQAIVGAMSQFYNKSPSDLDDPLFYHRLIESEKFAFAQYDRLGDFDFVDGALAVVQNMTKVAFSQWISGQIDGVVRESFYYSKNNNLNGLVSDHEASNVVVLDANGNGVSASSTINQPLGAMRVSPTLGFVWNNQMTAFIGELSDGKNRAQPGKRPMSNMAPTIIYDKVTKKVKMIVGASGGRRIISAVAQTIIRSLLLGETVNQAVNAPRFHSHFPRENSTEYESWTPEEIIQNLTVSYKQTMVKVDRQSSFVQALLVRDDDGRIEANSDFRRNITSYPVGY